MVCASNSCEGGCDGQSPVDGSQILVSSFLKNLDQSQKISSRTKNASTFMSAGIAYFFQCRRAGQHRNISFDQAVLDEKDDVIFRKAYELENAKFRREQFSSAAVAAVSRHACTVPI